jgi:DNA-directed RNA polymerase specialized sigma24 family protein
VSEADAADVSQDVFAAVARHIADFRRERPGDSFRGWLWTITRNKVRYHWRRLADEVRADSTIPGRAARHSSTTKGHSQPFYGASRQSEFSSPDPSGSRGGCAHPRNTDQ